MPKNEELNKDQRIKKELRRLNKIFKNLPENKKILLEHVIENAAYMAATLDDLQDAVDQTGGVTEYQNGAKQSGTKVSAELQAYTATMKIYNTTIKALCDELPKEVAGSKLAELMRQ